MNTLIIFIKNAQLGKVKTRLAATVGDEKALAIYQQLLALTQKITEQVSAKRWLFYSNHLEISDNWSNVLYEKKVQRGADLGERMKNAFQAAFEKSEKVLIIGSDCAALTPIILENAFDALDTHDFVIGPAEDGGYYLLGMKKLHASLFEAIAWSSEEVLPKTLQKIAELNKKVAFMPTLSDIDNEDDWKNAAIFF